MSHKIDNSRPKWHNGSMQAIRVHAFGEPTVLQLENVPDLQPGPGQVRVRLHAVGINPVETYIRSGKYARLPLLPYTPGNDGAGTVEAVGDGVLGWSQGRRVYVAGSLTGTYAEACLCEPGQIHPLPDRTTFAQGAALGIPYATAHAALFHRGQARSGETLLIQGGTGGVGIAALQFARQAGLTVFTTAGSGPGNILLRQQGATEVFDHHNPGMGDQVLAASGGRGVDLIVEMLANANLGRDLALLAPGGRVVVVGSRGPVEINARDLMMRNADIRGVMLGHLTPDQLAATHAAIAAGLESGTLDPVIARRYPLAAAAEAHTVILQAGAGGKIILEP